MQKRSAKKFWTLFSFFLAGKALLLYLCFVYVSEQKSAPAVGKVQLQEQVAYQTPNWVR